jgi:hypothetical protein
LRTGLPAGIRAICSGTAGPLASILAAIAIPAGARSARLTTTAALTVWGCKAQSGIRNFQNIVAFINRDREIRSHTGFNFCSGLLTSITTL